MQAGTHVHARSYLPCPHRSRLAHSLPQPILILTHALTLTTCFHTFRLTQGPEPKLKGNVALTLKKTSGFFIECLRNLLSPTGQSARMPMHEKKHGSELSLRKMGLWM